MINTTKQFFSDTLQSALNKYLALDPESATRLRELNGKLVALELLPLKVTFYLRFTDGRASVALVSDDVPETTIKGTPLRLLLLALVPHADRQRFFADDVVMQGNPLIGQQVIELFDQLEIDWEEYAAKIVGDVPAHHAGNIVRNAKAFLSKTGMTLTRNLNEYLHEEINVFPPTEALQDFFREVDVLRMDADRLQARVARLQKMMDAPQEKGNL
jgi:ubiquinone biosynthesis protein UbiJ